MTDVDHLDLHDLLIFTDLLGAGPVRDIGLLDSAVARARSSAFGQDAYPTVELKAAALMHSICNNHALVDGNERLALLATATFLRANGHRFDLTNDQAFDLVMRVAEGAADVEDIAAALTLDRVTQEHRNKAGFDTRAIHAGYEPDPTTGAVIPPIYATSTYKQDGVGGLRGGYEYSRSANPTRTALEGALAALEEGERGFAFASGLAAEDTILRALISAGRPLRDPRRRLRRHVPALRQGGQALGSRLHARRRSPTSTPCAPPIRPGNTRMVWVETPTNPLLAIGDIEALAAVAHDAGALLVVDNTFASPYLQQPLSLGADIVVHSTTKYVGGHSDVVGGAVVVRDSRHRRGDHVPPERDGRGPRAVRLLPHPPRHQDPRGPHGPSLRQRREGRGLPDRAPQGRPGVLPGPARAPRVTRSPRGR